MGFFDLFRPKWKHSDSEVRLSAIRQLDESESKVLLQVALGDKDPKNRRLALRKISDPNVLQKISKEDSEEEVRKAASEKLSTLFLKVALSAKDEAQALAAVRFLPDRDMIEIVNGSASDKVGLAALEQIQDQKILSELIRKNSDSEIQKKALMRISDPVILKELALSTLSKEITKAVIQKIKDPTILDELFRLRSKNLRQMISEVHSGFEEKASTRSEVSLSTEKQHEKRQKLCRQIEIASLSSDWDLAASKMSEIKQAWADLGPVSEDPEDKILADRFERSIAQFKSRKQTVLERLQKETLLENKRQECLSLCEQMESMDPKLGRPFANQLFHKFKALLPLPSSLQPFEKRFIEAYERIAHHQEKRVVQTDRVAIQRKPRLEPAAAELEEAYQQHLARLQKICDELEQDLQTSKRKVIEDRLKTWEEAVQNIDALPKNKQPEIRARFQKIRDAFRVRLEELKEITDWKRWSERTSLEQLCLRLEEIQKQTDGKIFLRELKSIRESFQALPRLKGPKNEPTNAELKEKYRTELKKAQQQARAFVTLLEAERQANLPKKEAICKEAEALSNSGQWKETAARMKQLQADWDAVGPIPKEQAQILRDRFRAAGKHFFARLREHQKQRKEELEKNLKQKEALCKKAEEMSSSTQFKRTTEQMKRLQTEWKAIGSVPRAVSESLNQRFRQACDQFFERKKTYVKQQEEYNTERLSQKKNLVQQLRSLLVQEAGLSIYDQMKQIRADWKVLSVEQKGMADESLEQEFQILCEQVVEKNKAQFSAAQKAELGKELSRFTNRMTLPSVE